MMHAVRVLLAVPAAGLAARAGEMKHARLLNEVAACMYAFKNSEILMICTGK